MNSLEGKIASVHVHGNLSLVEVETGGGIVKSVVIETPDTADYLSAGESITILFKETEVVVGKRMDAEVSIQNRLSCTLMAIERGKLLSRLKMQCSAGEITSIITTQAVDQLKLEEGDTVVAMIKTNEVMLSHI